MSNSNNQSSPDDKKVVKGTSTDYNQSGNTQPDKDKSQREAEQQGDKVAEGTAAYNQSVNKRSDKSPPPPKVNTKRKKVVKSASATYNQRRNKQSSTDTSSTQVDMQQYATKADLESAKGENIKEHGITREKNAQEHGITRVKMAENQTELKVYVGDKIQTASNFLIAIFISILVLVITLIGVAIAIIQSSNGS